MKVGDIVVNSDSYVGRATEVTKTYVTMNYKKAGKYVTYNWDIDFVRLADESEIKEFEESIK